MRRAGHSSAFTLIELMVVLSIIVIMSAIIFPTFRAAKRKARQAECTSQLTQIGMAVRNYKMDKKKYPTRTADLYTQGYLNSTSVAKCPEDSLDPVPGSTTPTYAYDAAHPSGAGSVAYLNPSNFSSYNYVEYTADDAGADSVWNYVGYDTNGLEYSGSSSDQSAYATAMTAAGITASKYPRMQNRFAPDNTIVTHCIHHRAKMDTAPDGNDVDIILRVSGSVKSDHVLGYNWQTQPN